MEHNGIAIVYKDGKKLKVKYIKTYSYIKCNLFRWGNVLEPCDAKIIYTDNIDDAFLWGERYDMETGVKAFMECITAELGKVTVLPINSIMFQRYFKIKKLKNIVKGITV